MGAAKVQGLGRLGSRWRTANPWSRFTAGATVVLLVGVVLPEGTRLPGPAVEASTTTTTTAPDPGILAFDAAEFLERWNTGARNADLGGLAREEYDEVDSTRARFVIDEPTEGLSWIITVNLHPSTGAVTSADFLAPLSEEAIEVVGALLFISAAEGHHSVEMSAGVIDSLLDAASRDDGNYFDETVAPAGRYLLSMSPETQFYLRVVP